MKEIKLKEARNQIIHLWERERLYYNFIRSHQGLSGLTPEEMAGLDVANGQNKWLELLKKSLTTRNATPVSDT